MYATAADMLARFAAVELAQLTDDPDTVVVSGGLLKAAVAEADLAAWTDEETAAAAVAVAVLNSALADASDLIDGYLQARYPLPMATAPKILGHYTCEIARYLLHRGNAPEHIETRYAAVLKVLEKINRGEINLGLDAGDQRAAQSGGPQVTAPDRVFTQEALSDY